MWKILNVSCNFITLSCEVITVKELIHANDTTVNDYKIISSRSDFDSVFVSMYCSEFEQSKKKNL